MTLEEEADEAARLIRYRYLPELVGTKLTVQSEESAVADVINAFGDFIDKAQVHPFRFTCWPAYTRYGITHLAFPTHEALLQQGTRSGVDVLCELGFVDPDDSPPALSILDGDSFLRSLRNPKPHFLIFLEDEAPIAEPIPHRPERRMSLANIKFRPHFPVTFKVSDACLGNTDWVWRYKHFYW